MPAEEKFLPEEPQPKADRPLDEKMLPKELKDLPVEPKELPLPQKDEKNVTFDDQNNYEVRTLLSWSAPGRPFRKRAKEYYINTILIAIVIEIILFLFSQYLLMLIVASLVFVSFALASVPPYNFHYRISTEGITVEDHFFLWQELYDFYFKKRDGIEMIHVRTHAFIPGELTITLGDMHKDHVKSVLLPYLPYREFVKPTFMEKSGDWLARTFPLDRKP